MLINSFNHPVKKHPKVIIAEGIYKDELVIVLDEIGIGITEITKEYLINYNGPLWVKANEITITKYF